MVNGHNRCNEERLTAILVDVGTHTGYDSRALVTTADSTRSGGDGSSLFERKAGMAVRLASLVREGCLAFRFDSFASGHFGRRGVR